MGVLKNLRQERAVRAYVRLYIEGESSGLMYKAYKTAYPHVTDIKSLYTASSRLFKKPHIQKRIGEVTKRMITRLDITEEKILTKYEDAFQLAKDQGKTADMISAATAQAKLTGLSIERREEGHPGDFDAMDNPSEILDALSKIAGPEAAMLVAKAMGYEQSEETQEAAPEADAALEGMESPSGSVN